MTHGFKIAGLALGLVVLGFGPAGAGGYKHSGTGSDIRSGTSTEGQDDSGTGVRGGAGAGLGGGGVVPGAPATGGTLGTDPNVHGPSDPVLKHPDQPSASPRMEPEPAGSAAAFVQAVVVRNRCRAECRKARRPCRAFWMSARQID